jgi:SagB-type dehydrogenase family enzyme
MLSNLLWAAFGINRPDSGKRTAPSAVNWQVIDIYVALEDGLYIYNAEAHSLNPVLAQDIRKDTIHTLQPLGFSVEDAPVQILYVADGDKRNMMAAFTDSSEEDTYAAADAGFICQNVYLFCASEGLGTVVRGMVDRDKLRRIMRLRPKQKIILAQTVGYPKE